MPSNNLKDYYYIIRETPNTEAIIVEYGFIDNIKDAKKINENYKKYADAVIEAVLDYKGIDLTTNIDKSKNTYMVKSGDTLWTIAKNNDISVQELKEINNLSDNLLTIGQILKIKNETSILENNTYIVQKGDTLYSIANRFKTTVDNLKVLNNLTSNNLIIGQKLIIYNQDNKIYTVQKGDSLYKIAKDNNTTVDKLMILNNLISTTITVGQKLLI